MKNKNTALHTAYDVLKTYIGNVPHVWNKDGKRNKDVTTERDFFVSKTGFMIVHERSNPRDKDNEDALERMLDDKPKDYGIYGKGIWWNLENGYRVSIQFGKNNYCHNYSSIYKGHEVPFDYVVKRHEDSTEDERLPYSIDAEVLIQKPNGKWLEPCTKGGKHRYFQNYNGVSDVLAILNYANSLEPNNYGRVAKK